MGETHGKQQKVTQNPGRVEHGYASEYLKVGSPRHSFSTPVIKPGVMANPDEKKVIEDDELVEKLKTEFPLSGGETDADLENALKSILGTDDEEKKNNDDDPGLIFGGDNQDGDE